jgi:hypothetical protein
MVRNITKRMLCTRAVYHVLVVGAGAFLAQRGSRRLMKENKSKRLSAHQSITTRAEEDSVSQQSASASLFTLSEVAQVMLDHDTWRVYRLFDFTKRLRLTPGRAYCVPGKVKRQHTLPGDRVGQAGHQA